MKEESKIVTSKFKHTPVLVNQVLEAIAKLPSELLIKGKLIDATIGGGGHSALILKGFPSLHITGLDQDPSAIDAASKQLLHFGSRAEIISSNFADFVPQEEVAFVLADLGVSSPQIDEAKRGFSFRLNGPLDMRMNPKKGLKADELLEKTEEKALADLIYKYGEEKFSRRIARRIKQDLSANGPYEGTSALAYAIAGCYPPKMRNGRIHPATRTFQALRIAINNELDALQHLLQKAPNWLLPGGVFAVISFHSLEDRLVKKSFLTDERLERITRKPIQADSNEKLNNPRSRSAKLRLAKKRNPNE
ncbi:MULTISPECIES: 16S rRNA (cytosine(1402)-N(4))-methyltransferase RsmH [Prochlorococcus]|uniref:Ribosomal RNA small subunit methyltransferase H n=1 Tax=Prochlorococcus marinus (strain SARG / CCMP1375 / SS120) TaxID=167539 RepID=RSMH_PROMA|nr:MULTISPECIES: 16S rRNA (cytosine(1402)-N(4))-methyltransferase RsmH [Prochlorococcus]Q7VE18.1 RecName: Full=Ribosomal RNA small subunit methyltransferase H; AltName: Full=16S rRNA m(4)C1402 methyltransferase; AltName: Full=rRNA (cytosine-N(4)-)-methyltransferase RsmH [Prochlorococcus marinus subsp. marinus str. CCMP1375]AAP99242.1 Predicted S-adenosylmethionine-dependent methyltransferase [Prochlorococcus marinus subsp. marinus str. CCMP1375]KGG11489.1 rRNA small subunit methyltransferase H [